MRDAARQNLDSAQQAYGSYFARATWFRESVNALRRAPSSIGVFDVTPPSAAAFVRVTAPVLPAWSAAKTRGKAAVLPDELAKVCERLIL
jgi:hypothetical protein